MAIFHLSSKPISRSSGRSAVAAAAYRTQSRLVDEHQGLTHDYERRSGVEHAEIVLPEGADREHWTRQRLWNAAELAEVRKDARTAREWELALPEELTSAARQALAVGFARELASRYGCAVDVAVHAPGKEGDRRNHHAHLLATTRVVLGQGMGDKTGIELSDAKRLSLGLERGRKEIEQVRELWATAANRALEAQYHEVRIDHRSLAVQREEALTAGDIIRAAVLNRSPEIKLGWKATAMERRGIETERGEQLREIQQENRERSGLLSQLGKLKEFAVEQARAVEQYVSRGLEGLRERLDRLRQARGPEAPERGERHRTGPPEKELSLEQQRRQGREASPEREPSSKEARAPARERGRGIGF